MTLPRVWEIKHDVSLFFWPQNMKYNDEKRRNQGSVQCDVICTSDTYRCSQFTTQFVFNPKDLVARKDLIVDIIKTNDTNHERLLKEQATLQTCAC